MSALSMFGRPQLYPIFILAVTVADLQVTQTPDVSDVMTGENVTFHCIFPLFRNINNVKVYWWKDAEREFLNSRQDPRKSYRIESKASATLRLWKVKIGDAGVYYCRVEGEFIGNGTGVKLSVRASPDPLKISSTLFANGSRMCLCKTSGFYPAKYTIAWHKNGQEVVTKVDTFTEQNAEGLYEVSSYLEETQPVQSGTIYICEVFHSTLKVPTRVNYTVSIADRSFISSFPWWIYLCGALSLLLLIIAPVLCCKFCKCKAPEDNVEMQPCVRCSESKTARPKRKEEGAKKGNTQPPPRNPNRVAKVNDTAPKVKKHRKRDRDPICA
ncbi:natural cytotoxicity triggering receptor 3 ligand 1-like isoform X1 [Heptranchias perlo]|uniref:natural cytotoxicity triggering receptor 3 ligand 1-like isoform X1 n=1 Tax=Heptranchias perlo TaxID=212740 RepID=UPI00355942A2